MKNYKNDKSNSNDKLAIGLSLGLIVGLIIDNLAFGFIAGLVIVAIPGFIKRGKK